jgi:hypothetical protein
MQKTENDITETPTMTEPDESVDEPCQICVAKHKLEDLKEAIQDKIRMARETILVLSKILDKASELILMTEID